MTVVILHPDTERSLSLAIRRIAAALFSASIPSAPIYPLWGIVKEDIDPFDIKRLALSLSILPPVISSLSLTFPASIIKKDLSSIPCPITALSLSPPPKCTLPGIESILDKSAPPFSYSPSSPFRIADGVIEEKGALRTWQVNRSYWVKPNKPITY